jgi:hypothetical protein
MCEDAAERDQRFPGAAFRDGRGAPGLGPPFRDTHNGERMRRKRRPFQLPYVEGERVAGTVQRRKLGEDAVPKLGAVSPEVLGDGIE